MLLKYTVNCNLGWNEFWRCFVKAWTYSNARNDQCTYKH